MATLIEEFVKVINSGKIPNINNTWDSVIEKDVTDACRAQGLEIVEITRQGEWVSVTARRN